jgi:hypothetical protein
MELPSFRALGPPRVPICWQRVSESWPAPFNRCSNAIAGKAEFRTETLSLPILLSHHTPAPNTRDQMPAMALWSSQRFETAFVRTSRVHLGSAGASVSVLVVADAAECPPSATFPAPVRDNLRPLRHHQYTHSRMMGDQAGEANLFLRREQSETQGIFDRRSDLLRSARRHVPITSCAVWDCHR